MFVNEMINDADNLLVDWTEFRWSRHVKDPHRPWKWTIDRDRDAFLVMLCGTGRENAHPEMFGFSWRGAVIKFSAEYSSSGDEDSGIVVSWKVFDVEIPQKLQAERATIIDALWEAIDAHGRYYDRTHIRYVKIALVESPNARFRRKPQGLFFKVLHLIIGSVVIVIILLAWANWIAKHL